MRKKIIIVICICLAVIILWLISCIPYKEQGLSAFSPQDSSRGLTSCLIPGEAFIERFPYLNGDYQYYDNSSLLNINFEEKAFLYLEYDAETYAEAKEYCLSHMYLSQDFVREYNGYVFMENHWAVGNPKDLVDGKNTKFPYYFNMFGYNDDLHQLFFIGYLSVKYFYSGADGSNADLAVDRFAEFLDVVYSEYYEFDENN